MTPLAAKATQNSAESSAIESESISVGIANHYKIGHWATVDCTIKNVPATEDVSIEVTTVDNDGIPVTSAQAISATATATTAVLQTCPGRLGASLELAIKQGGNTIHTKPIRAGAAGFEQLVELPITAELILWLGASDQQILDSLTRRDEQSGRFVQKATSVTNAEKLPTHWITYSPVDLVILTADSGNLPGELASDPKRLATLIEWVERGGRLVIFSNGPDAETLLATGKPLAALLPGKLADTVRLPETGRLEHYAGSEISIAASANRIAISVPRLSDVQGSIEVYEGRRPVDLPLVVRAPRGLGEITFVAIDLTKAPFATWAGRNAFLQTVLRPYLNDQPISTTSQTLVSRGYIDLSGALRQRIGHAFSGVTPFSFSMITLLALAYLVVLGPLDYFVVRRWTKRPLLAWLTFPAIVLLFGGLALGIAGQRATTEQLHVNQVDLIDVDATSGLARGTTWATIYRPAARRVDIGLNSNPLQIESPETYLHSWPLPGTGIGGTQSRGLGAVSTDLSYRDENNSHLIGVPILTSGTKSILARWFTNSPSLITAELTNIDGLVSGSLENNTGHTLRNARLLYGDWGYRLGTITNGARIAIGEDSAPRSLKTIVTQDAFGESGRSTTSETVFLTERATISELVHVMMFYDAIGGYSFTRLPNNYQSYCDLSRLAQLGRAILVAQVDSPGSNLVDDQNEPTNSDNNTSQVIYRFILPVE